MQVVRLHGPADLRLCDEPIPTPSPGESLVRVTATGVCGSDLHWFSEVGIGDARVVKPREYLVWPTHCLHPLPDALTDADGAMLEPLGVAILAVDLGHVKPGMTVGDRDSTRAP